MESLTTKTSSVSTWCTDFKNVIFEKDFPFKIALVARSKFLWIHKKEAVHFFSLMHWFQKCNFWKESLSLFRGRWGQEVIFEVAEAKFWISSSFDKFSFRIFVVLCLKAVWPRCPQNGPRECFQKLHYIFEISAFQGKRWGLSRISSQHFHIIAIIPTWPLKKNLVFFDFSGGSWYLKSPVV